MSSEGSPAGTGDRDPTEVVRRFYAAYGRHDIAATIACCAPGYRWHGHDRDRRVELGLAGFRDALLTFWASFPDATVEILDAVVDRDRVAVRLRETAHHTGAPWLGRTADGVAATWYPLCIYRIADGRLAEEWSAPIDLALPSLEVAGPADGAPDSRASARAAAVAVGTPPTGGRLAGRRALVTGGASGIGLAIVRAFL